MTASWAILGADLTQAEFVGFGETSDFIESMRALDLHGAVLHVPVRVIPPVSHWPRELAFIQAMLADPGRVLARFCVIGIFVRMHTVLRCETLPGRLQLRCEFGRKSCPGLFVVNAVVPFGHRPPWRLPRVCCAWVGRLSGPCRPQNFVFAASKTTAEP